MNQLINDLTSASSSSSTTNSPKIVFVGGKGGVGKTSISSALAVELASAHDLKTLIVSTDPAHSLGDALDINLSFSSSSEEEKSIQLMDPLTRGNLYAHEIDASVSLQEFQSTLETFDIDKLAQVLGVNVNLLENLGLREFSNLLRNPPPGLDELIALSNVLDASSSQLLQNEAFEVVIVDTAPTGHTLRLLSLPQFLDGFLSKLLKLRQKLLNLTNTLQSFFGASTTTVSTQQETLEVALQKLQQLQLKMTKIQNVLKDASLTNFVIVSIATKLSTQESKRLHQELISQGISVSNLVVNQCLFSSSSSASDSDIIKNYYERRKASQTKYIQDLLQTAREISGTPEYQSLSPTHPIKVSLLPYLNTELVSIPALSYLAQQSFVNNPAWKSLLNFNSEQRFVICGGKGGVGKTTTSSTLAIAMANAGHNVAIISTDPAHSLGDALDIDLSSGTLVDCSTFLMSSDSGSLSALEINPSKAIKQFQSLVDNLVSSNMDSNSPTSQTLKEITQVFDTLPAGSDEVIALAQVINIIKREKFDRIVLDTAPTGHTLRMLSTPSFLAELIDRVLIISEKINSNAMVKMLIKSATASATATSSMDYESMEQQARSKLLDFQMRMYDLEDLFSNIEQTEFCIVTIPTELAVRESIRLLNDLVIENPDMPIMVRNVVVNQVLPDDDDNAQFIETFVQQVEKGQLNRISWIKENIKDVELTLVPYLDTEPRGVYGLKVLANELIK